MSEHHQSSKVVLLGGAPMTGKSTIAAVLAAQFDYGRICTDDLAEAVRAVIPPTAAPALNPMANFDYREYYGAHSSDELWEQAVSAHRALWPAVNAVARAHREWGTPAIIEGWALLPELVGLWGAQQGVCAGWVAVDPDIIRARLWGSPAFLAGAPNAELLIDRFVERSRRYNEHIFETAPKFGYPVVQFQAGESAQSFANRVWEQLRR